MHSEQQSSPRTRSGPGSGGSGFGDTLLGDAGFNGRRAWFGRKRFGYGYRPQTWQGWLLLAVLTALLITTGSLAPRSPWFFAALAALLIVPFAVIAAQRRR